MRDAPHVVQRWPYKTVFSSAGCQKRPEDWLTGYLNAEVAATMNAHSLAEMAQRQVDTRDVLGFLKRVAAGPCWARRVAETDCKDALLPKGERPPSDFCLRCHAVAVLEALGVEP